MPALLTTAIVGGALLVIFALCRAMADADASTPAAIELDVERAARRHPSNVVVLRNTRPFDWALDGDR